MDAVKGHPRKVSCNHRQADHHTRNWPGRDPVSCARRASWAFTLQPVLAGGMSGPELFCLPCGGWQSRPGSVSQIVGELPVSPVTRRRSGTGGLATRGPPRQGGPSGILRRFHRTLPFPHRFASWPERSGRSGIRGDRLPRREHSLMLRSAGASSCPDAALQDAPAAAAGQCPRRSHFVPDLPFYPPAFHRCSCFVRISVDSVEKAVSRIAAASFHAVNNDYMRRSPGWTAPDVPEPVLFSCRPAGRTRCERS